PKRLAQQTNQKIRNAMLTLGAPASLPANSDPNKAPAGMPALPGGSSAPTHVPALVLDYECLSTDGIWEPRTFYGETNYLCSGSVSLYSLATIEAGTCFKFSPYPDYSV